MQQKHRNNTANPITPMQANMYDGGGKCNEQHRRTIVSICMCGSKVTHMTSVYNGMSSSNRAKVLMTAIGFVYFFCTRVQNTNIGITLTVTAPLRLALRIFVKEHFLPQMMTRAIRCSLNGRLSSEM